MFLRPYQIGIVDKIKYQNAIVKMPTGSGKTIVAAAMIERKLEREKDRRVLFLVPTKELAKQQATVVARWCPSARGSVGVYHGGLSEVTTFRVLVSTPQAFRTLQVHQQVRYSWSTFSMVIYDEVHHVLKDHPYRRIAMDLWAWHRTENQVERLQILGLSASLTYEVQASKVKATLDRLCRELSIDTMISPSMVELEADGYVPQHGRNVEVLSTHQRPEGVIPDDCRKPHLVHTMFMNRIHGGTAIPFSSEVFKVIRGLENTAQVLYYPDFESPLRSAKLSSWEDYAHKLAKRFSGTAKTHFEMLECWYVALRVLVQTWEEETQIVMQWLKMKRAIELLPSSLRSEPCASRIQECLNNEHNLYKLGCLANQIYAKKEHYGSNFKCIVFVEQRFTAMVLSHFLNIFDSTLLAAYVASSGSTVTPSIKVTKSMVAGAVEAFRDGCSSVLVATSVIEEGFDVPEANVVVLYDHLKDSVQLCQRFGRARATHCSIVVMAERRDRPLSFLEEVRQEQDKLVQHYDASTRGEINPAVEEERQRNRERSAFSVLENLSKCRDSPAASLNEYVKKTKALLGKKVEFNQVGKFACKLTYSSSLRSFEVSSADVSKKAANVNCCKQLLALLLNDQQRRE